MRIQVEIEDSVVERAMPYIHEDRALRAFILIAFEEWVARREARDKRAQEEKALKDEAVVIAVIKRLQKGGQL